MYTVYLKKNEERRILEGHPWVYANEVLKIEGKDKNGSLATVVDYSGKYIGKGYINHLSKILVRIMIRDNSEDGVDFLMKRIAEANTHRVQLGYSDCYRMVFSEADDLPGLIVDKYHDVFCIQLSTYGMDLRRDDIVKALVNLYSPRGIYERSDIASRQKEGLAPQVGVLYGDFEPQVEIVENGLKMRVDMQNGQKTGYFLDQKENRLAVRRYVKQGGTVLDCFTNVGGFSLNCAVAGASDVTAMDISDVALAEVRHNASLNGLEHIVHTEQADVFEALRKYRRDGVTFDTVILDPPAFCKSAEDVKNAYKGYRDINTLGMKIVKRGGYLISSSCSHHIGIPMFMKMLKESASISGRQVKLVEMRTQAPDHPSLINEDEGLYLKFFVLQII